LVAALWAVFPRGVMQSTISFTCADCGHIDRVRRLELRPPAGMPFRYPGITLTDEQNGPSAHSAFSHANYRADVKSDLFCRGTVTGWADCSTSSPCEVNGLLATLQSAPILLEEMLSRTNSGIQIGDGK
jgi:hypothetical protein